MLVKNHIIFGFIFSVVLTLSLNLTAIQFLIIFLASFLIDADHYLNFIFLKNNLNFFKARRYHIEKRKRWLKLSKQEKLGYKIPTYIFHGIEFFIMLLILSFVHKIFLFILIGAAFHMLLDYIELIHYQSPLYSKFSQIGLLLINPGKKDFK